MWGEERAGEQGQRGDGRAKTLLSGGEACHPPGGKEVLLLGQFSGYLGCHSCTAPLCDQSPPSRLAKSLLQL